MRRAPAYHAEIAEIHAWIALKNQIFFLDAGWTFVGETTTEYSHLYFDVLHNLVVKLKSTKTVKRLLAHAIEALGLKHWTFCAERIPFEFLPVVERNRLLQIATWLLMDWPGRFLTACREMKVRHSEILFDMPELPYWFQSTIRELEFKPVGPCPEERRAMKELYEETHDPVRRDHLKKHMRARLKGYHGREVFGW